MLLKRKRSESEFSHSSCSTGSASNSPPRLDASSSSVFSFAQMENTSPFRRSVAAPSHLPSRTMKRFRDNRPSEEEVHQRTINMLFSAAQRPEAQHQQQHEISSPQQHAAAQQHHHQQQQHQSSLHNFWNLPNSQSLVAASAPASQPPHVDASLYAPSDCEDCGRDLCGAGGDDDDMDTDMDSGGQLLPQTSCAGCGKHVCSHCSITHMGERRRCLACTDTTARKSGWTGGVVGWASSSSSTRGPAGFGIS